MRFVAALVLGLATTVSLFLLMQWLIDGRDTPTGGVPEGALVDVVRVAPSEKAVARTLSKPAPPVMPPAPPQLSVPGGAPAPKPAPPAAALAAGTPTVPVMTGEGPYLGDFARRPAPEGDIVPVVRFPPRYPRNAHVRQLEGWVRVRFTIEADGSVSDPHVVESEPLRIFDREAVRAIARWKFKPRVVDGLPVAREAEQLIEFTLGQR